MDLLFQNLESLEESTFKVLHVKHQHHLVPLHYHAEIEIMYIIQGHGTRVVGDSVESFNAGDFVMVGSNVPHVWKSGHEHYKEGTTLLAECLVLFIPPKILQVDIFAIPEFEAVQRLLESGDRGIRFSGQRVAKLKEKMHQIRDENGLTRIVKVLELLNLMLEFGEYDLLSSRGNGIAVQSRDFDRLSQCVDYLLQNYDQKIELGEMADLANMTPNSFCRYFKKRTSKTFSKYLIDLRVGKASKLLVDTDHNINQIAFESGFNSLSNFNEHFKKTKKQSPSDFRSNYRKLMV